MQDCFLNERAEENCLTINADLEIDDLGIDNEVNEFRERIMRWKEWGNT